MSICQRVHRDLVTAYLEASRHRHLAVLERDLGALFQQLGQFVTGDRDRKVFERAIRITPERHFGRFIEHHLDQLVAPTEFVFVGDATQRAFQPQAVFVLLVVEQEVFAQHVVRERDRQQVARQRGQAAGDNQGIGVRQIQVQAVRPLHAAPAIFGVSDSGCNANDTAKGENSQLFLVHVESRCSLIQECI